MIMQSTVRTSETERLVFREFSHDTLHLLYPLISDAEVMQYFPAVLKDEQAKAWLEKSFEEYKREGAGWWALHRKEDGAFIGQAWLLAKPLGEQTEYLIGYMLHKEYWGKGFATEVAAQIVELGLNTLKLNRITCLVSPDNTPSIRVAEKVGFKYVKQVDHRGVLHNLYIAVNKE